MGSSGLLQEKVTYSYVALAFHFLSNQKTFMIKVGIVLRHVIAVCGDFVFFSNIKREKIGKLLLIFKLGRMKSAIDV